jgi:hypothetical protein
MIADYKESTEASDARARTTAHSLIKHDGLPLQIRIRALTIIGCFTEGDFVRYAEEAVHFARIAFEGEVESSGDVDFAQSLLETVDEVLTSAKAAAAAKVGSPSQGERMVVDGQDDEEEEDDEVGSGEGEVVWDEEWDDEKKAAVRATWAPWPPAAQVAGGVAEETEIATEELETVTDKPTS